MKKLILLVTLFIIQSCSKQEFLPPIVSSNSNPSSSSSVSASQCSKFTYVRPPVDLLFLWDNSSSSIYLNSQTKSALNNLINTISDRYDYNVLMAPLIPVNTSHVNNNSYFFSRQGTVPGNGISTINWSQAASVLDSFPTSGSSYESGTKRAIDLIRYNQSNGVFRKNAYTLIITMSNEDDDGCTSGNYACNDGSKRNYAIAKAHDLLCMRGNYNKANYGSQSTFNSSCSGAPVLNSLMMRYLTVTAQSSNCSVSSNSQQSVVYDKVSDVIYNQSYTNGFDFTRIGSQDDKFNICSGDYANIFSGVNDAISDAILKHQYRYWPLSDSTKEVDTDSISITKSNGVEFYEIPSGTIITRDTDGSNDIDQSGQRVSGFRYVSNGTYNTRFLPTVGEPFSGQAIELFGDAKVIYPECLLVNYTTATQHFGYVKLADKPNESTIRVTKNGANIPQSTTNGWELIKSGSTPTRLTNFNIRIEGPGDYTPKTPGKYETGYFLKLNGSSVYRSGDSVKVNYSSTGN